MENPWRVLYVRRMGEGYETVDNMATNIGIENLVKYEEDTLPLEKKEEIEKFLQHTGLEIVLQTYYFKVDNKAEFESFILDTQTLFQDYGSDFCYYVVE